MVYQPKSRNPALFQASSDPVDILEFRQVTSSQVLRLLGQNINPFSNFPWSQRYRERNLLDARRRLPVFSYMQSFYEAFNKHQIVIVHGDTGTGKTTQIPQLVAYADLPNVEGKIIGCVQTRRIAATAAARRVADEMDVRLGKQVGYSVRFDSKQDPGSTFLLFMTDGMLLNEATRDPTLSKYSTIILDEVHERTIATDILIGLLKGILKQRPDLKLIIMSATMDAEQLGQYFEDDDPFLLEIPGCPYNVDVEYSIEPEISYVDATVQKVLDIHRDEPEGDVLVFLTGEDEIEETRARIEGEARQLVEDLPDIYGPLLCLPLYSNLPQNLQQLVWEDPVFDPEPDPDGPPGRKVILATNIAETSLTIDGIVYIVDPGFFKPKIYDPDYESGFEVHTVQRISKASAHQRKGRAGRTREGKCFRLYTEDEYEEMREREIPELQTVSLGELVLMLATNGYKDPTTFPYLDAPDAKALMRAQALLKHLRAIDSRNSPTDLGRQMVKFPLDVQLSKMLITSPEFHCSEEIATIAAMLSAPPIWYRPYEKKASADDAKRTFFADTQSDHLTLLNAYNSYLAEAAGLSYEEQQAWCSERFVSLKALREAGNIRNQLVRLMKRQNVLLISSFAPSTSTSETLTEPDDEGNRERLRENIRKALVSGFFLQVAHNRFLGDMALGSGRHALGSADGVKGGKWGGPRFSFKTVRDEAPAGLHPSSVLPLREDSEWVIFHSFVYTTAPYIRTVTNIKEDWLWSYSSTYYDTNAEDKETRKAISTIRQQIEIGKERAQQAEELQKSKAIAKQKAHEEWEERQRAREERKKAKEERKAKLEAVGTEDGQQPKKKKKWVKNRNQRGKLRVDKL